MILKLININNLSGKKDEYLKLLNQKYDSLINEFSFNLKKGRWKTLRKKIESLSLLTNFYVYTKKILNLSQKVYESKTKILDINFI